MSSVIEDFTCIYSLNYMYPKVELKITKIQSMYKLILIIKEFINNS